ncbi:MAG: SDR family NAD(P)-dependent oxidoreductase [Rhodospirillales bacterium]|nr:SDR family NAD(P)-dependent oxidoreductase [Rhodospirillales bacterium]
MPGSGKGETRGAIVTGGAGAIGVATTRRLLASGHNVAMVDRSDMALRHAVDELAAGPQLLPIAGDATDPAQVAAVVAEARAAFGRIDILVNLAGGAGPTRVHAIEDIDLDVWTSVMDHNLRSAFLFARAVVPHMRERHWGRIVNFSSTLARGEKGLPTTVTARLPYATAKAALIGLTAQLAKDVAADGITVNALMPGLILGEAGTRIRARFESLPEPERRRMVEAWPMGRPGEADEVAAVVAFLVSADASFVSGVALPVDGAYL